MHNGSMASSRFPAIVDEVTVRLIAAVVLVVSTAALVTQQWWLLLILAADFTLRATLGPRLSPIARLVTAVLRPRVSAPPKPTAGVPKRFAASIGAVLTSVAALAWLLHLLTGSGPALAVVVALTVVMVVFPALESVLGICVGCIAFGWLMRLGAVPEEICLDCADITRRARVRALS